MRWTSASSILKKCSCRPCGCMWVRMPMGLQQGAPCHRGLSLHCLSYAQHDRESQQAQCASQFGQFACTPSLTRWRVYFTCVCAAPHVTSAAAHHMHDRCADFNAAGYNFFPPLREVHGGGGQVPTCGVTCVSSLRLGMLSERLLGTSTGAADSRIYAERGKKRRQAEAVACWRRGRCGHGLPCRRGRHVNSDDDGVRGRLT